MAEGAWVVLGAAIGTIGSVGTTWLNAWLSADRLDNYDKAAIKLLTEMLANGSNWRTLEVLSNVVGMDAKETKELLLILGARASETDPALWGLVSRNPLPTFNAKTDP
jgi:hypothetical protein